MVQKFLMQKAGYALVDRCRSRHVIEYSVDELHPLILRQFQIILERMGAGSGLQGLCAVYA